MSGFTPYGQQTDEQLMGQAGVQGGTHIEAMRRLRVAVEEQTRAADRQSRAGTFFAWAFVALAVVQIAVAVYDAVAP